MTDKLSEEKLLILVEHAFGEAMCVQERKVDLRDLNQACEQIMALIRKLEITEEWINEKASKVGGDLHLKGSACNYIKDFIREIVEEVSSGQVDK